MSDAPRCVYFVLARATGLIKIGVANDVGKRLRALCGASPDRLTLLGSVEGTQNDEAILHSLLSEHRRHGEWFDPAGWAPTLINALERGDTVDALRNRLTRALRRAA